MEHRMVSEKGERCERLRSSCLDSSLTLSSVISSLLLSILAELHGRKPLFPGDDYIKQMNLIFNVLGTPDPADMKFISNEKALEYIKSLKKKPKIPFSKIYKDANPLALDLMEKMLTFN